MPWDKTVNPEFINKSQTICKNKKNVHFAPMTEKSSALGFPIEVSPRSRLSGGPHVFHEANSFAITLAEEPAGQACGDPEVGKACDGNGEGEERDVAGAFMPSSGRPKGSSAQPSTWRWVEAKDSQQLSRNNSPGWGNCAGSALASVPSGQLRTTDMPVINVACSVNNETDCGKLFLKHPGVPENCPAPLIPTAAAPFIKEPHFAKTLSTHLEQELDWRYAMCSYKDGEEAEGPGTGLSARVGGSSGFPKPSASCPDVLGVDRIGDSLLTEREISSCHSDSSKVRLEGKARSPTIMGVSSRRKVADHQSSQTQLVEVKSQSSEWLEQRYLLEHVEGTLEESSVELSNRISMEGNCRWQTKQSSPENEWQLNFGDPLIPKSSLSQKAGQENADGCQERAGGSLLLPSSEAEPKSARTELKENGPRPPAEAAGQAEPPHSHLRPGVAAASSGDQPGLSSTLHAWWMGVSKKAGRGQGSHAPSLDQESSASDPEMSSLVSSLPALFPAMTLPECNRPTPEGDQATGMMHLGPFCPLLGKWSRDRPSVEEQEKGRNSKFRMLKWLIAEASNLFG